MEGSVEIVEAVPVNQHVVLVEYLQKLPYFDDLRWNCLDSDNCDVSSFADDTKTYLVVFNRPHQQSSYQIEVFLISRSEIINSNPAISRQQTSL